jgi:hypothetical protein
VASVVGFLGQMWLFHQNLQAYTEQRAEQLGIENGHLKWKQPRNVEKLSIAKLFKERKLKFVMVFRWDRFSAFE